MADQRLVEMEARLRSAVADQNLDEALLFVEAYGRELQAVFEAQREDPKAMQETYDRASELFRWVGRMARVIRQTASVQLGRLGVGTVYIGEAVRRQAYHSRA